MTFGHKEWHHFAVSLEEWFHINHKIFFEWKTLDCLNRYRVGDVEIFDERLASKSVAAIDPNCI